MLGNRRRLILLEEVLARDSVDEVHAGGAAGLLALHRELQRRVALAPGDCTGYGTSRSTDR